MDESERGRVYHVTVGTQHWDTPLTLPARRFKRFERQMDRRLAKLVSRWIGQAAPKAAQGRTRLDRKLFAYLTPE